MIIKLSICWFCWYSDTLHVVKQGIVQLQFKLKDLSILISWGFSRFSWFGRHCCYKLLKIDAHYLLIYDSVATHLIGSFTDHVTLCSRNERSRKLARNISFTRSLMLYLTIYINWNTMRNLNFYNTAYNSNLNITCNYSLFNKI